MTKKHIMNIGIAFFKFFLQENVNIAKKTFPRHMIK